MHKTLLLLIASFLLTQANAQDKKRANQFFQMGNFEEALDEYELLVSAAPANPDYHYRLAICYLNTNIDKSEAVPHLELVVKYETADANAMYLLGRAYHYSYEFEKAIKAYQTFKESKGASSENMADVDKQIEYCQNAMELMKFPLDVTFENLGGEVNSGYADYYPFGPMDEAFIMFNSKRDDGSTQLPNGSFTTNIYVSTVKDGKFTKARTATEGVNTNENNEEIVGMSGNGEQAILYFDNESGYGDLYLTNVVNASFTETEKLDKNINSRDAEIAATVAPGGDAIYFASDRDGGMGGVDLYISRKLPNGKWAPAQNLGPSINTAEDEDFPNISPDGLTLYFSSKGHTSMGGYDIFKAVWDESKQKFSGVRNMGYPINTPEDNMNFRVSATGEFGYISALRSTGYGDLDIYRVKFNTVEPRYTVITGTISAEEADKKVDDVFIFVTDLVTGEEYGNYTPNPKNMRYVIILPPGKFQIDFEADGYEIRTDEIEVMDKSSFKAELERNITLK